MMHIYESAEDYLEAILMLQEKNGHVRSIDVANMLNFSKPSVSIAMKKLRENGYVETDANGLLTLTPEGLEIAARVYERHRVLSDLLMALGVSAETARADACRIEHDLSDETWEKIKQHAQDHLDSSAPGAHGIPCKRTGLQRQTLCSPVLLPKAPLSANSGFLLLCSESVL